MGGIVLSNYLARPVQVALNAAVCLSGTFDILANKQFERSLELWQPVLTFELKKSFAAQWNHLIEACTTTCMSALHECFNMLDWDTKIIAPLNGHGHVDEASL